LRTIILTELGIYPYKQYTTKPVPVKVRALFNKAFIKKYNMPTLIGTKTLGNGVNLQPSYYNPLTVQFGWALMQQQPKIKTVRIEIEPDCESAAKRWIAEAQSHGYQVIATYHKDAAAGTNDEGELMQAANWWVDNYDALGGNFLINLMNEWGNHDLSATAYSLAYNQAISKLRQVYNDYIIVDLPGWGQDVDTASEATIADERIVWSVHVYPSSFNSKHWLLPAHLDKLKHTGRPCIIGEFGNQNQGNCNWQACVAHARDQLNWTVIGWCWNGDGDNKGTYNMVTPSWKANSAATAFAKSGYFNTIYSQL
jgi:mannan endo-1,4-beta-mannosidase